MDATPPSPPAPPPIAQRRCRHHPGREAVARCTGCAGYFCRECVAPYDHRLFCAACLGDAARGAAPPAAREAGFFRFAAYGLAALLIAWGVFHVGGAALSSMPTPFQAPYTDDRLDE